MSHGGFEDDPDYKAWDFQRVIRECRHPEHDPPKYMVIPRGKQYRHVCPGCGYMVVLRNNEVSWLGQKLGFRPDKAWHVSSNRVSLEDW